MYYFEYKVGSTSNYGKTNLFSLENPEQFFQVFPPKCANDIGAIELSTKLTMSAFLYGFMDMFDASFLLIGSKEIIYVAHFLGGLS